MRKYDFIFGLGNTCKCTMALREAGLQFASFPLDWSPGPDMIGRTRVIVQGFEGWLEASCLEPVETPKDSFFAYYKENKYGFTLIHDFLRNVPFEEDLKTVQARHARRVGRFLELIGRSKRVLVTWVGTPTSHQTSVDQAKESLRMLEERYPGVRFDMLLFDYAEGVPLRKLRDREDGPVRLVSFDYRNHKDPEWAADQFVLARWLKTQYEMADYRTPEEKAAWEKKVADRKWGRYNAKNLWEFLVNKYSYKLYVHLRKRLQKRGLI